MMSSHRFATPFSLLHAASLLSHTRRIEKFKAAVDEVVTEDRSVVDLGTGTGVLALLAARAGARRVVGVDLDPLCIEYARAAAAANGLSDRVQFVVSHFADFALQSRADVVICEMLSSMMLVEQQVEACAHAVKNVLREGGVLLPRSATVYAVPVECPNVLSRFTVCDLTFRPVPQTVDHTLARDLADPVVVVHFDFNDDTVRPVDTVLRFTIVDSGTVHGLVGFFEAVLTDRIRLEMTDGWRDLFVPLSSPVRVESGDELFVRLRYRPGDVTSLSVGVECI